MKAPSTEVLHLPVVFREAKQQLKLYFQKQVGWEAY